MNPTLLQASLRRFDQQLVSLVSGLSRGELLYRPAEGAWSIQEIVGHILDEERVDFRPRLERTLRDPAQAWDPIDPERAVREGQFHDVSIETLLASFGDERARSLAWLDSVEDPAWDNAYEHPALGSLRAGDLLLSWASHDLLHSKQILQRSFQYAQAESQPFDSEYAGPWT